jgi:HAD superfamily hydrolase (TIGR01662 family)
MIKLIAFDLWNTLIYKDKKEDVIREYSHTISMLESLKEQGFDIGLITNSSHFSIERVKKETKIFEFIDYAIFSFNVGAIKPSIKMFEAILEVSKCKPAEIIMVGDSKKDDVIPPRELGIHSIHYTNYLDLKKDLKKYGISF